MSKLPPDHKITYMSGLRDVSVRAKGLSALRSIRLKCVDCSGGSLAEVAKCAIPACPLYPYRMGKRPVFEGDIQKPRSEKQIAALRTYNGKQR